MLLSEEGDMGLPSRFGSKADGVPLLAVGEPALLLDLEDTSELVAGDPKRPRITLERPRLSTLAALLGNLCSIH